MDLKALKLTKRRLDLLAKMEITTIEQLLQTYPLRYEKVEAVPFDEWKEGDNVAFEGLVVAPATVINLPNNRTMTRLKVMSWNEEIQVTVFNRPWPNLYPFGHEITVFGQYQGKNRVTASSTNTHPLCEQEGLRPVYSLSKGMKQNDMKAIIEKALPFAQAITDPVPLRYRKKYRLASRHEALRMIHQPKSEQELHQAIRTLKYEEFLCFQCAVLASGKEGLAGKEPKVFDRQKIQEKVDSLPYQLTEGQKEALEDILNDLEKDTVMYRMVQGDVGCGKTAVAALSLYACVLAGQQAAFLAPTEILAAQHVENLKKMGIEASLLSSSLPVKEKKKVLRQLETGELPVAVGTHALFQEQVKFRRLGLVIADEQQRFGVRQRRALLEKGVQADFLMMSATPIPRTYAHFMFGDIAMSSIRTLPPGRKPVKTVYVPGKSMKRVLSRIVRGIEEEKRQVYVVCPAIEENPDTPVRAATQIYEGMEQVLGNQMKIGLLHGKMKAAQKEEIMEQFSKGEIQILVSTTVIEVGIDVPNATMMVIYDAHRFGLSTLHQLRGRTARGKLQGECYLLSPTKDPLAIERLKQMEVLTDGFAISEYDLKLRGPGDLLGTRQSGLPAFVLGSFDKDPAIMEVCYEDAKEILNRQDDIAMLDYVRKATQEVRYMD